MIAGLGKIMTGSWILAESDGDFGWIIYLIFFFFVFIGPIIKKAAEALGFTKKEPPLRRPGMSGGGREQKSPIQEALNEVEDFFRKYRKDGKAEDSEIKPTGRLAEKPAGTLDERKRERQYSEIDYRYQARKRELEELRRRKAESKWKQARPASKRIAQPEPESILDEEKVFKPIIKSVLAEEPQGLVVIEEPASVERIHGLEKHNISTIGKENDKSEKKTGGAEKSFFEIMNELPETARMVVFSEVLAPPKSIRLNESY